MRHTDDGIEIGEPPPPLTGLHAQKEGHIDGSPRQYDKPLDVMHQWLPPSKSGSNRRWDWNWRALRTSAQNKTEFLYMPAGR